MANTFSFRFKIKTGGKKKRSSTFSELLFLSWHRKLLNEVIFSIVEQSYSYLYVSQNILYPESS